MNQERSGVTDQAAVILAALGGVANIIAGLHAADVEVDRKVLADLAVTAPEAFTSLVKVAEEALASTQATAEAAS